MKQEKEARRSFLKHVLAGSVVAAGTVVSAKSAKARSAKVIDQSKETLYTESEAFKSYYQSLR